MQSYTYLFLLSRFARNLISCRIWKRFWQSIRGLSKAKVFCRRIHVHHQIQLWQFCQKKKSALSGGIFSFICNLITSVENGTPRTSYYLLFKKSQGTLSLCTPFEDAFQEKIKEPSIRTPFEITKGQN